MCVCVCDVCVCVCLLHTPVTHSYCTGVSRLRHLCISAPVNSCTPPERRRYGAEGTIEVPVIRPAEWKGDGRTMERDDEDGGRRIDKE